MRMPSGPTLPPRKLLTRILSKRRRTLRNIRRQRLTSGGSLLSGLQGAAFALEFALIRDILVEAKSKKRGHVRPTRGVGSGLTALVMRDVQRLWRQPMPLITLIEILSFLSRPLSLSVRLFANMLAGHITLKVFASFIGLLATSLGVAGWLLGVLPFGMLIALTALELLVAFLQAYVFTVLNAQYISSSLSEGH